MTRIEDSLRSFVSYCRARQRATSSRVAERVARTAAGFVVVLLIISGCESTPPLGPPDDGNDNSTARVDELFKEVASLLPKAEVEIESVTVAPDDAGGQLCVLYSNGVTAKIRRDPDTGCLTISLWSPEDQTPSFLLWRETVCQKQIQVVLPTLDEVTISENPNGTFHMEYDLQGTSPSSRISFDVSAAGTVQEGTVDTSFSREVNPDYGQPEYAPPAPSVTGWTSEDCLSVINGVESAIGWACEAYDLLVCKTLEQGILQASCTGTKHIFDFLDSPKDHRMVTSLKLGFGQMCKWATSLAGYACHGSAPIGWACFVLSDLNDWGVALGVGNMWDWARANACCSSLGGYDSSTGSCHCSEVPSDCQPPINSFGDVHFRTLDKAAYNFQGAGEYILLRSNDGRAAIQTRQEPWRDSRVVSVNTAVAMYVDGDTVGVYLDRSPHLEINGMPHDGPIQPLNLPSGGTILFRDTPSTYTISWPNGVIAAVWLHSSFLDIGVSTPDGLTAHYSGLLGNGNGDPWDDIQTREGSVLAFPLTFEQLYSNFGRSWLVRRDESLFSYAPGTDTDTFYLPGFPERPATLDAVPAERIHEATTICQAAGVFDGPTLEDCVFDIALTQESDFATAAGAVLDDAVELPVTIPLFLDGWGPVRSNRYGSGVWVVSEDGRSVRQAQPTAQPTFFVSPHEDGYVSLRGTLTVLNGSYGAVAPGFVFGYKSPAEDSWDPTSAEFDFVLLDWHGQSRTLVRNDPATFAPAGLTLSRVHGPVADDQVAFYTHDAPNFEVLASSYGEDQGWTFGSSYDIRIDYEPHRFRLWIDGTLRLDVSGSFPPGRIGFYGAQFSVEYSEFLIQPIR